MQVFQDVPSDYAFKTMTMEAFPHTGQQLASVHPCKHASVMKKFIDRMESAQPLPQGPTPTSASASAPGETNEKSKKKWGLGGMVRKVTGGVSSSKDAMPVQAQGQGEGEEPSGLQVDFYLVIVCRLALFVEVWGSPS